MDTKAFEYIGKQGVIRGRLTPITNRSEMMVSRWTRVLAENLPGLIDVSVSEIHAVPDMNIAAKAVWRFTNLARVVEVEGLSFAPPGMFAGKDEILAAWECFLADDPGFWRYLGDIALDIDEPEAPPEARPESMLTGEQLADPNSDAAGSTTAGTDAKKSKASSGGGNRRGRGASITSTTGRPS